jgi:glycosyltransferase involved in cell wall biosynthesis
VVGVGRARVGDTVKAVAISSLADTTSIASAPRVSVAVSTYNRTDLLPQLIEKLSKQTLPPHAFEVVITDNGSTDATPTLLQELVARTSLAFRVLRVENNRGPAQGRNVAWRHARAPIVAFTDDDCSPVPEWLERGIAALGPDNLLVGRTRPDPALPQGPFSRTVQHGDATWMPTCNVFYWRADLEAVDGFDESFVKPGGEDTDLGLRVVKQCGREVRFDDDALVYHDVRPSNFVDALKETQRWSTASRFFRQHPHARQWLYRGLFWKPTHPKALLALVGIVVGVGFFPALLLTIPWLRYRIFERPPPGGRRKLIAALPGVLLIDLAETVAMVRGSIRYRTLVI